MQCRDAGGTWEKKKEEDVEVGSGRINRRERVAGRGASEWRLRW